MKGAEPRGAAGGGASTGPGSWETELKPVGSETPGASFPFSGPSLMGGEDAQCPHVATSPREMLPSLEASLPEREAYGLLLPKSLLPPNPPESQAPHPLWPLSPAQQEVPWAAQ